MTDYKELVILGLLKDGPKHGYEIKKLLRNVLKIFTTVDTESIYYPLKALQKKGFLEKEITRQGHRPQRNTYRLTDKGREYFNSLVLKNFLSLTRPFVNIDLSLYFYPYLDRPAAARKIKIRQRALERVKKWLVNNIDEGSYSIQPHLNAIFRHNLKLVEAEIDFTKGILREIFDD